MRMSNSCKGSTHDALSKNSHQTDVLSEMKGFIVLHRPNFP